MRHARFIILILVFIFTGNTTGVNALFGGDFKVKFVEKFEISSKVEKLKETVGFCVIEDEIFIIPDQQAGNIKIYEKNGAFLELTKSFGRKGPGVNDFIEPTYCFYSKKEDKFGVFDMGKRTIFLYDRIGRIDFGKLKQRVYCMHLGYDVHFFGDAKLLISGFRRDEELDPYDFYAIDISTGEPTFLLPSFEKYGLKSIKEYNTEYHQNPDIKAIGLEAWFDVQDGNAYFVWEGNLRILKLNIRSMELHELVKKPPAESNYKEPVASKELLEAHEKRNFGLMEKEKYKGSIIKNFFSNSNYLFVVYEGPGKLNFWMQFYKLDGTFLNEVRFPGPADPNMWFDKDRGFLYSLVGEADTGYSILKYKIQQQ